MHQIKAFFKFVEIQTKVASFFPFLIGTLFAVYKDIAIDIPNLLLMFFSLLMIDLTTTGLNHYMDYRRAVLRSGYHYQVHNPLGKGDFSEKAARTSLWVMLSLGAIFGIVLVLRTDLWVLFFGAMAFFIGVVYSFGPVPISRTILGELMSGVFMGGLIPLLSFYVHAYNIQPLTLSYQSGILGFFVDVQVFLPILVLSLPLIALIAGIMLANNICDREEDFVNKRYTLPVTMGLEKSLMLYKILVGLSYLSIAFGIGFDILPIACALVFVTMPAVTKQTAVFTSRPVKGETFINAVKNFVYVAGSIGLGLFISIITK
ncbi:MAG: UbiA family prenyltransferase [Clostridia bacterium]|nr:UbiA family prenyltransferase [Clostridia bacterium]